MKKIICLLSLFSYWTIYLMAQSVEGSYRVDPEKIQRSPQVADMMRFGDVPIAMNSGRLDLSIPITKLQDPDFDIEIGLNYNSSGFMPMKRDGCVGLNWSLNNIGSITREVKGMPDDQVLSGFSLSGYGSEYYGFLKVREAKNIGSNSSIINDYINNLPIDYNTFSYAEKNVLLGISFGSSMKLIDACSDIYHFNFGKHSGKFMINYDGSINVVSYTGGKYEVDISEYKIFDFRMTYAQSSIIKIKTDDGYTYHFGGDISCMEYNIMSWHNGQGSSIGNPVNFGFSAGYPKARPVITSFYLGKIVAPNNRNLYINYKTPTRKYLTSGEQYNILTNSPKPDDLLVFSTSYSVSRNVDMSSIPEYNQISTQDIIHNLNKIALVSSIFTDDNEAISFNYSSRKASYIGDGSDEGLQQFEKFGAQLDEIIYSSQLSSEYKTYKLKYSTWGSKYPRRMLSELIINGGQKYSFTYWGDGVVPPPPYTTSIDYWNYWKGGTELYGELLPEYEITQKCDLIYTSTHREPATNSSIYNVGMLRSIVYPTGGSSEFEYEQHDYSQILDRRSDNGFLPKLYDENKRAGGIRIKRITDISDLGQEEVKEYVYKKSINDTQSSGILQHKPKYYEHIQYLLMNNMYYYLPSANTLMLKATDSGFDVPSYESDHITYSTVIEKKTGGGLFLGYTQTQFSDYNTNPDILFDDKFPKQEYAVWKNDYYSINFNRELVNMSHARGKMISQKIFDKYLNLQKEVMIDYLITNSDKFSLYFKKAPRIVYASPNPGEGVRAIVDFWPEYYQANKILFDLSLLKEKTVKDFFLNNTRKDSLVTKETFVYDNENYLVEQTTSISDKRSIKKEYIRPINLKGEEIYDFMSKNNYLSPVIRERSYLLKENEDAILISQKRNNYRIHYSKDVNNLLVIPVLFPVIDSKETSMGENALEKRVLFPEYDDYGNPLLVIKDGDVNSIHLWSYMGKCMIAEIKYATYQQVEAAVMNIFDVSDIKSLSRLTNVSLDQLNSLRSHPALKNALVSTYLHDPFFGVISATDISGKTTYYEYDNSSGRLKRTYIKEEGVEKNIQSYEYNYSIK